MEWICHLNQSDLQDYMHQVFGTGYFVANVTRMYGGAQKVVYKIDCRNGFSCVLYVWDLSQNYFREEVEKDERSERSYGSDLFELINKHLTKHRIRTPALYDLNQKKNLCHFDYALVEYVDGPKAEQYFNHSDLQVRNQVFERLGELVSAMHAIESQTYGKPDQSEIRSSECHQSIMKNAIDQLSYASQYMSPIKANQSKLHDKLAELQSRIVPRGRYSFIHGELGPDHVLIDRHLEPYLIDIEGGEFFDIEHEHSFLQLRFGDYYRYLQKDTLDPDRLAFYRLSRHVSLTSGGLKLFHRGFPDPRWAKELAEHHAERSLRFIEGPSTRR